MSKIKKIIFIILILSLYTGITYATDFKMMKTDEKQKIISEIAKEYECDNDCNSYQMIADIYYQASDGTIILEEKNNFYNYNNKGWLVKGILPNTQNDITYIYDNCSTFGEQLNSNLLDADLLMDRIEVGDILIFSSNNSNDEQVMLYIGFDIDLEYDTIYCENGQMKKICLKHYLHSEYTDEDSENEGVESSIGYIAPENSEIRNEEQLPLVGIARPFTINKTNSLVTLLTDGVLYGGQLLEDVLSDVLGSGLGNVSPSIDAIIFNEYPITRIDYFRDDVRANGDISLGIKLKELVSFVYSAETATIIVVYIFFLVYIGIKILAISIAEEQAKYKQSLIAWLIGLLMLLSFHFVMGYIIEANDLLINFARNLVGSSTTTGTMALQNLVNKFKEEAFATENVVKAFIWLVLLLKTLTVLIKYIKRLITLTILILLFPFVTLGYVLDRMKGRSSRTFDIWFTAFSQNVFINFLDAMVYLIVVQVILDATAETLLIPVIAIMIFSNISDEIAKVIGINKKAYLSPINATAIISKNSKGVIKELRKSVNELNKKRNADINTGEVNAVNNLGRYNSKENRLIIEMQKNENDLYNDKK